MSDVPTVTVLIPARNEEMDIERCLRAVLAQDHPHDRMEVVLVDGGSTDRTGEVASRVLAAGAVDWKIIDNPTGTTPSNLNVGLAAATGDVLCRVDARSIIPRQYVRICAGVLSTRPEVAVTGGAQVAVAVTDDSMSVGIARALNNRYAMGGSRYRSGASSGPSDTVYLGAFRTDDLRAAGGWDEFFETNQDYELNRRMSRQGIVWFDDRLEVGYVPRQSLVALWRQYHRFGRWKVRYWRRTGDRPQSRQLVPFFALAAAVPLALAVGSRHRAVLLALVAGAALALDECGSRGRASVGVRMVSAGAIGTVSSGWCTGVARGVVATDRAGAACGGWTS